VLLIVLLALLPQATRITHFKFMDLEAEIAPSEAREILAITQSATLPDSDEEPVHAPTFPYDELLDRDPNLALARLRMDIEGSLLALARSLGLAAERAGSAASVTRVLIAAEELPEDFARAIREVMDVCNRAIHGAQIDRETAAEVVDAGTLLLRRLNAQHIPTPIRTDVISHNDIDAAQRALYRVETMIPLVDRPIRKSYVLSQQQLDRLLEGYDEYAEFLVSIAPVHNAAQS
jgi:hypothetical protein